MSPWSIQQTNANAVMAATWGIPVTFTPQDKSGAQGISGVIKQPAMLEDYPPPDAGVTYVVDEVEADMDGGAVLKLRTTINSLTSVVRLWVNFAIITPRPQHGDTITF